MYLRTYDSTSAPYFFGSNPTPNNVETWLKAMTSCYTTGYHTVASGTPSLFLSFSNSTNNPDTAGQYAGNWVYSTPAFWGSIVDFEGQWSSEANAYNEVAYYHSYEPGGYWWDAGWNSEDWTYSQVFNYIDEVDADFWGGSNGYPYLPENYYQNMNSCSGGGNPNYPINTNSGCSENPWVGSYVDGATIDTSNPSGEWNNYQSQGYPIAQSPADIVGAYWANITESTWKSL